MLEEFFRKENDFLVRGLDIRKKENSDYLYKQWEESGDEEIMHSLITKNIPFFVKVAIREIKSMKAKISDSADIDEEDLFNEGIKKVIEYGFPNYVPDENNPPFVYYAADWMQQGIRRAIKRDGTIKIPEHSQRDITILNREIESYVKQYGNNPTIEELSELTGKSVKKIENILDYNSRRKIAPFDTTISLDYNSLDGEIENGNSDRVQTAYDSLFRDESSLTDYENLENRDLIRYLIKNSNLTEREEDVLNQRYGLDGNGGAELEFIGIGWGITKERVRQIHKRAIEKIRENFGIEEIKEMVLR